MALTKDDYVRYIVKFYNSSDTILGNNVNHIYHLNNLFLSAVSLSEELSHSIRS